MSWALAWLVTFVVAFTCSMIILDTTRPAADKSPF